MNLTPKFYFSRVAIVIIATVLIVLTSCSNDPEPPALPQVNSISPISGLTNTPVTITGTNFSTVLAENKVTFNGKEAVITIATATQITTTVPLLAETGSVVVTVKDKTAINQPTFTVDSATPEVSKISPASGVINTVVVITGTNFSSVIAENKVTFNGKEADVTLASPTQLTATVPTSAETGQVVVTAKGKTAENQPVFTVISIPVLTTGDVKTLTPLTAAGGGNVTSDGGAPIMSRGICWGTNPTPIVENSKTVDGTGKGVFASSITGLTEGLVYYARAYATNSAGTAYGNVVTFTALVIGQVYGGGGQLYYLLQPGDPGYKAGEAHGLVVISSPSENTINSRWMYAPNKLIGTSIALGTGNSNTTFIVGGQGSAPADTIFYAATFCYNMAWGGRTDWYLPSKDELNKLYINRDKIPGLTENGRNYYWSSSEAGQNDAWIQSFVTGAQSTYFKGTVSGILVRPIRSF
jgi:hypothetical protein